MVKQLSQKKEFIWRDVHFVKHLEASLVESICFLVDLTSLSLHGKEGIHGKYDETHHLHIVFTWMLLLWNTETEEAAMSLLAH